MLDLVTLRKELKVLTRRKKLYSVLKEGLTLLGYWKLLPRGNPKKAKIKSDEVKNGKV